MNTINRCMKETDYHQITKEFSEFEVLLNKQKTLKKEINKTNRKLKTLSQKYSFLSNIVDVNMGDDILEQYLKKYFKEIGFKDVRKIGKKGGKEDLQIHFENELIIMEVTGIKGTHTTDRKTRQITKHLEEKRISNENVYGLFIVNHDKETYFKNRNENPFSKEQIKYAVIAKYSLVTTIELVKGFIKVKMGELTINEFKEKLCYFGMVQF